MKMSRARVLALALTFYLSSVTVGPAADNVVSHDQDYDYDPPVAGSYSLPVIKRAPDGAIIDSDSKTLNLRELTHGRITVLSFIYTRWLDKQARFLSNSASLNESESGGGLLGPLGFFVSSGPVIPKST